jgi:hypothetical protein
MRNELFVLWLLFGSIPSATAQVSVEINLPGASIGINQPVYPELVAVPGYPVYYAPQSDSNYFFYDGMYWVYQRDNWYASSWYNGPWGLVGPEAVPLFILRIPVQYYRRPPAYFQGWSSDAAPRWGEHWGDAWDQRRHGWDTWDRASVPASAPLPVYQRQYSGNRYPAAAQQQALQSQNYRYQPHEVAVRQAAQAPRTQPVPAPVPQARQATPQANNSAQQAPHGSIQPSAPQQSAAAPRRGQPPPQQAREDVQRAAAKAPPQQGAATTRPQEPQSKQAVAQGQHRAPTQQGAATARPQEPQSKQAVAQGQHQAPRVQAQNKGPAPEAKAAHPAQPPQQAVAQHQAQQPQQGAAQHQEQAPSKQAPQTKAPAQEPKQGPENGREKG